MPKPFHEAVISLINEADAREIGYLGKVIMVTKIPDQHIQSVLDAWKKKTRNPSNSSPVTSNLLARLEDGRPTADELCEVRGE